MNDAAASLSAALSGRYRIEREIGAGGMATVYLAEDLKHHRKVAIKVLNSDLAATLGAKRFQQEIEIAAGLQHPHILAVHDSGEADGFLYYIMPYVEGESLRQRLDRGGRLPVPEVVRLLLEVADALAQAHANGVVHRDIKPENIMLSGRHAMVMDFGVAKAVSDASERRVATTLGVALGTPSYMAPEQAAADPKLDHRADIYALGVLGYELLSGRLPFIDGTPQEILAAHLTKAPEPITLLRPDIPPVLANMVMRALAKQPGDRWQNATEITAQLEPLVTTSSAIAVPTVAQPYSAAVPTGWRRWRLGLAGLLAGTIVIIAMVLWNRQPTPAQIVAAPSTAASVPVPDITKNPSIAVLPFVNMSEDRNNEYFSDGISEELLNLLAKVPKLRVIARTSSFSFKGKAVPIPEIARALNVTSILEGSVRKSGDKVRITVQLVRADDGTQVWSETYDRTLVDIFKVQDDIAAAVVGQLKISLLGAPPTARPVNPRAYPLILQANALADQGAATANTQAVTLYQQALAIAPEEPRAWAGLGRVYMNQASASQRPVVEGSRLAKEAYYKVLANDPDDALAYSRLGWLASSLDNDLAAAARNHQKALALDPTDVRVIINAGDFLLKLGRLDEAIALDEYGAIHDPANTFVHTVLGGAYYSAGRWNQAIASYRTALSLSPGRTSAHFTIGMALLLGKHDAAGALQEMQAEPLENLRMAGVPMALYALGRKAESDAALAVLIAKHGKEAATLIALVAAYRGEPDRSFEWLGKAVATQDPNLPGIATEPLFAKLHKDPRWLPLLRRLGSAPEQLAKIEFKVTLPE